MKTSIFIALVAMIVSVSSYAGQSWTACGAYTQCYASDFYGNNYPNGQISCQVYGSSYASYHGNSSSQCTWSVVQGVSVSCAGFVQARDHYGRIIWGWQNYHYRCPGR